MAKTYTINSTKRLVDLNGDSVNFKCDFQVTSPTNKPFEMVIVDQTTLDSGNFAYNKVTDGSISGTVTNDKNVYQNHFIVLKSDEPQEVVVEINKQELPKTQIQPKDIAPPQEPKKQTNYIKLAVYIAIGATLIYVVYQYLNKPKEIKVASPLIKSRSRSKSLSNSESKSLSKSHVSSPSLSSISSISSHHSASKAPVQSPIKIIRRPENPFSQRLKKLNLPN